MGVEIERKFLVDGSRFRPPPAGVEIRQGWLARDETRTVRVRLSRPTTGAAAAGFLTVKGSGGLVRSEYEYAIPPEDAGRLLDDLCLPGEIAKVRYEVAHAGHTFEVDVYSGRLAGLVTAEVELDDPSAVVETPPWVVEEVTGDPRWSNAALSRAGSPPPDDR